MSSSPLPNPTDEYARRLNEHQEKRQKAKRSDALFSVARFAVFLIGVVHATICFSAPNIPYWTLLIPLIVFVALILFHARCRRTIDAARRREAYYERGLQRLKGDLKGEPVRLEDRAPADHLYAEDLDLFGPESVFTLLCAAGTGVGRRRLAEWLCRPATLDEARARQGAVRELTGRLDLREDLALTALDVDTRLAAEALTGWAEAPAPLAAAGLRLASGILSALAAASLGAWALLGTGGAPFALIMIAQIILTWRFRTEIGEVVSVASDATEELKVLARLLERLESESFDDSELSRLRSHLDVEGQPPSRQIKHLARRVDFLDQLRHNQLLYPVSLVLMGVPQAAMAIEAWRLRVGPSVRRWVSAVGEFEALASLARFAYEHPDYAYPELVDDTVTFEAEGLGHPLLPREQCVRNDLQLGGEKRLLLVSGSNMSGKSTLLRTVGVNTVLALAGAPVCATKLNISAFSVGASIRVQDSLLKGSSRFYAEISRIKAIVEKARETPTLLFLLDEIFGGTNSQDRRAGATGVIQTLIERGAVGLVTTHDLALAEIAEKMGTKAENVHFEDDFRDGRIYFDYHIRQGILRKGNALALMRSIGLDV